MVKRFHSGRAAQSGVYSARLAQRDFTGITDVLEAAYGGYLSCYSDTPECPAADRRARQHVGDAERRLQAARQRHQHPHGARRARRDHAREQADRRRHRAGRGGTEPDDPRALRVAVQGAGRHRRADEPVLRAGGHRARRRGLHRAVPRGQAERSRASSSFIERIDACVDREIEGMGAEFRHAARVKVRARDGRAWEKLLLHRRGSPEHPLDARGRRVQVPPRRERVPVREPMPTTVLRLTRDARHAGRSVRVDGVAGQQPELTLFRLGASLIRENDLPDRRGPGWR